MFGYAFTETAGGGGDQFFATNQVQFANLTGNYQFPVESTAVYGSLHGMIVDEYARMIVVVCIIIFWLLFFLKKKTLFQLVIISYLYVCFVN